MKRRKLRQRAGALLLALTMMMTISQFGTLVHAAELPDESQFATVDELKAFNTDDTDGTTGSALVYFGDDGYGGDQWWWIVGSQGGDTIVLWPYEPRSDNGPGGMVVSFFPKGDYTDRTYEGKVVGLSHYGASDLRKSLAVYEEKCFTSAERALMNDTTFYTEDTVNNEVYAITSKLYLGFGFKGRGYFTVGRNTADDVYAGLRVDEAYIGKAPFWLSSADRTTNSYHGVVVWEQYSSISGGIVQTLIGNGNMALMPAFELDLSTVLFGSTAPIAASEGALTARQAFTLRYASDNLGSAEVSVDRSQVNLKDVPAGTYLVAQNSEGIWATSADGKTSVLATDLGLDSFTNCKVWLEMTNSTENKTYATMATERNGYTVEVQAGQNMTVTTGNSVQTDVNGAIADITVKADDGYYLPENYKDGVTLPAGFTIVQNGNEVTISGTATSDVVIDLPDASIISTDVTDPENPDVTDPEKPGGADPEKPGGTDKGDIPQTGDDTNFALCFTAAFVSLAALFTLPLLRRKEKQKMKHLRR